jgi:NADPH:quinone reductase-like Zn-dependent oxidoreductase
VIATEEEDLVEEIRKITGGEGARVVFDPVGGSTVEKLARAMKRLGILFLYGALSREPTTVPLLETLGNSLTFRGYLLKEITDDPSRLKKGVEFVNSGLADGRFQPIIAKTFPFEQIAEAHRYLESNQQIGKVVVTV